MILVIGRIDGFSINFKPQRLGKTLEELAELGVLLEAVPEPEAVEGAVPILSFDGANLYYEYKNNESAI